MNILSLKNKECIKIVAKSQDFFKTKNIYTDYMILKYNNDYLMIYKYVSNIKGQHGIICNKIKKIGTVFNDTSSETFVENFISLDCALVGVYDNGLNFKLSNIFNIEKCEINKKELEEIERSIINER